MINKNLFPVNPALIRSRESRAGNQCILMYKIWRENRFRVKRDSVMKRERGVERRGRTKS